MSVAYLLLGANLGDRFAQVSGAMEWIAAEVGLITRRSSLYETQSWGVMDQPPFLNQVIAIETAFSARQLLRAVQKIEDKMGRTRKAKWESRLIDIDILFYNEDTMNEPDLIIPHPYLAQRKFTLVPLEEIAAEFVHPVCRKTIREMLLELEDPLEVLKVIR